jgi:tRNA G46 methylase TrmB
MKTKKNRNLYNKTKKNRYINRLKELYPSCKHDKTNKLLTGIKTYGEMDYDSIQKLYNYVTEHFNPSIDCFIDIGSGRGKLCMYMAAQPKIKHVIGIELVKERHNDAVKLKSQLGEDYDDKISLLNKDLFDVNFKKYNDSQIFIWFSNCMFIDFEYNDKIFKKLQKELPKGTIICCSTKTNIDNIKLLKTIKLNMSWKSLSNVYIYEF